MCNLLRDKLEKLLSNRDIYIYYKLLNAVDSKIIYKDMDIYLYLL